jgi:hypothetical protein
MQIKLDELIRAMEGAHNALLDLEELEEKDLSRFRKHYEKLAEEARTALRAGGSDTDSPFVDNHDDNDDDRRGDENRDGKPGTAPLRG